MTKFKKLTTAIATGALLLNAFTPFAFAETSIEITGNGASSDNNVKTEVKKTTTVVQNNDAYIKNNVDASAKTGNNSANDNTGGDVTIDTGNASTTVDLSTKVNLNKADVNNCNGCDADKNIKISDNGSESKNDVKLKDSNETSVYQDNEAKIKNYVDANSNTGKNDVNRNTGGDVTVITGHATTDVSVSNTANANIARVGSAENGNKGSISAQIIGNGSDTKNNIDFKNKRETLIVQDNDAYIKNDVDAYAKTGKNDANDNTGGSVLIGTGNANASVVIDNLANFNSADVSCCKTDVSAKVSGNGADSKNKIKADFKDELSVFQGGKDSGNRAEIKNYVDANGKTGGNEIRRSTAESEDPVIITGHADSDTTVSNSANANIFGSGLDFDFNIGELLGLLQI